MSKKHRRRKKKHPFIKFLKIVVVLLSIITIGLVYSLNILPVKYFAYLIGGVFVINLIILSLLSAKKKGKRAFGFLLSILLIIVEALGISYELSTIDFFNNFGNANYKTENYNVIVWDNSYSDIKQLNNKTIGHLNYDKSDGLKKAIQKLNKIITYKKSKYDDIGELTTDLSKQNIDAIILEDSQLEILEEENIDLFNSLTIINKTRR